MRDIVSQITISEVLLLFVLIFVIPINFLLVKRLRKYEAAHGEPPPPPAKEKAAPAPAAPETRKPDAPAGYPFASRAFLSPPEKACLAALREALGDEVEVFPKVALWTCVEPTDRTPGYAEKLHGLEYDFLVCDRLLCQPMTAVMFKPGKGRPAGRIDEIKKVCAAAKANLVFIELADEYDAKKLKDELGIPELDM